MSPKSLSFLLVAALAGCTSKPLPVQPPPIASYTLVWLRTGPQSGKLSQEHNREAFAGHFENMRRLAEERKLLLAGPFGDERHASDLRGLFVLGTSDVEQAEEWASTDPTAQAGVFVLEYQALATEMPLPAMLDAELERFERRHAAGETPQPGEGARGWALLIAEHGDLARRELEPLISPDGGVFLLGELPHGRLLAVLDAQNAAAARERYSPELAAMGAHTLDDWFATDLIATLVR